MRNGWHIGHILFAECININTILAHVHIVLQREEEKLWKCIRTEGQK